MRRALLRRGSALAAVILVAVWVGRSQAEAEAVRDRWEATTDVLVARTNLDIGTSIDPQDLELQKRPVDLVPDGSLQELPAGSHHVAATIVEGETVLEERLGEGLSGSGAVPPGRGALEVESPGPMPAVGAGDRVDVLAAPPRPHELSELVVPQDQDRGSTAADQRSAVIVAEDAIVLGEGALEADAVDGGVTERGGSRAASLTLAIADADIEATAAALLEGPVTVVVRPSPR